MVGHGQHQQVRMGDRMVNVSLPTSMYSPYSITTSGGQQQSMAHLPPHVQASMIQAERERMERGFAPSSIQQGQRSYPDSRSLTPTSEHDRLVMARGSNVIQSAAPGQWTPTGLIKGAGGVIQSTKCPPQSNIPNRGQEQQQYIGPSYHPHKKAYMHHSSPGQQQQHSPAMGHHAPGHGPPGTSVMFARTNDAFQTLVDAAAAQQSLAVPGQGQGPRQGPQSSSQQQPDHHGSRIVPTSQQGQMLYSALNFVGGQKSPGQQQQQQQNISKDHGQQNISVPRNVPLDRRAMDSNEVARDRIRQLFVGGNEIPDSHPRPGHGLDVRTMAQQSRPGHDYHGSKPIGQLAPPQQQQAQQFINPGQRKGSPPGPTPPSTVLIPRPSSIAAPMATNTGHDEAARLFSRSFEKDSNSINTKAPSAQGFTAANLIDAIITHQINNTVSNATPPAVPIQPPPPSSGVPTTFSGGLPPVTLASTGSNPAMVGSVTPVSRPSSNVSSGQRSSPPTPTRSPQVAATKERRPSVDSRDEENSSPTDLVIDDSASDRPPSTKTDADGGGRTEGSSSEMVLLERKELGRKRSSEESSESTLTNERKSPEVVVAEKKRKEESSGSVTASSNIVDHGKSSEEEKEKPKSPVEKKSSEVVETEKKCSEEKVNEEGKK